MLETGTAMMLGTGCRHDPDRLAAGGETSGWALRYRTGDTVNTIELDVKNDDGSVNPNVPPRKYVRIFPISCSTLINDLGTTGGGINF